VILDVRLTSLISDYSISLQFKSPIVILIVHLESPIGDRNFAVIFTDRQSVNVICPKS